MKLLMYLDKNLVDCVRIDYRQVALPGYLGSVKRELQKKHTALLEGAESEPEFLLTSISRFEQAGDKN